MEAQLLQCFAHTLSPSADERTNAEKKLKEWENQTGFIEALLQIMQQSTVPVELRLAAAIQAKQVVHRRWSPRNQNASPSDVSDSATELSAAEKVTVRGALLPLLQRCAQEGHAALRRQTELMVRRAVESDWPSQWEQLVPNALAAVQSGDGAAMAAGLAALREIVRKFQLLPLGGAARRPLHQLVQVTFPVLAALWEPLLAESSITSAQLQIQLLKIFWGVMKLGLPPFLLEERNFQPWMAALLRVLQNPIPPGEPSNEADRAAWPGWYLKRMATQIFTRLFQRYGETKGAAAHELLFCKRFCGTYAPGLLSNFLQLLSSSRQGQYLPERVINEALNFVDTAIFRPKFFKLLEPHIDSFFQGIVFPIMCFGKKDKDLWEEDPVEYLRKEFDLAEEFYHPRTAATNITIDVATRRKKHLQPIMNFIGQVLQRYSSAPPDQKNHSEKEGALFVLGSLNEALIKSEFASQIEGVLQTQVLPEFQNPHGFIRARTCWTFAQFGGLPFKDENLFREGFRHILRALRDPELPVQVLAALSLRLLVDNPLAVEELRAVLPQFLEDFFQIMNAIDFDELVNVVEMVVDELGQEIGPYSVALCGRLTESFRRMATNEDDQESTIAAMECLGALQTLLYSIRGAPQLFPTLEGILVPLLHQLLEPDAVDFFEESLKILSFLTYYSPTISEGLWSLFPKLLKSFEDIGMDFISDLLIPLDNFIARGTDVFLSTSYPDAIFKMYQRLLVDPHTGDSWSLEGCKLAEVVLLNCRGRVDPYLEKYIELAVQRLSNAKRLFLKVGLVGLFANAFYYNPSATLAILERRGWTASVFEFWLQLIPKLVRLHDKKMTILALSAIAALPLPSLPQVVQNGMKQLLETTISLQLSLNKQRAEIEETRKARENAGSDAETSDEEEIDDDEEENDLPQETIEALAQQAAAAYQDQVSGGEEDEDELDDEELDYDSDDEEMTSVIDSVDELASLVTMFQTNQGLQQLLGQLDASVQGHFRGLLETYQRKVQQS